MFIPLKTYVQDHGQTETANRLGLTQGAIWQMLQKERNVMIQELANGTVQAVEQKIIGRAS